MGFLTKLFGDYSTKEIKRIRPLCDKVLKLEDEFSKLTDEQLQAISGGSDWDFFDGTEIRNI
jgi:preprotein translocase subunit SecA